MSYAIIAHNIRSALNVGSFFRTCDGFSVDHLYLTGYTPYPRLEDDRRLPHIVDRLTERIHKTALGAEATVPFSHEDDVAGLTIRLKNDGYAVVALEQAAGSVDLYSYKNSSTKLALIVGEEVNGIDPGVLAVADEIIEIPMKGSKESFNVSVALGIALYELNRPI